MSITKSLIKSSPKKCKVRFKLTAKEAQNAQEIFLAGTFNEWKQDALPMKKAKDGGFSLDLDLPKDKTYLFRYYTSEGTWINDAQADGYEYSEFAGCDNSVLKL